MSEAHCGEVTFSFKVPLMWGPFIIKAIEVEEPKTFVVLPIPLEDNRLKDSMK